MRNTVFFVIFSYSSTLFAAGIPANTLPSGGQVSAGQAAIQQSGASMTINQSSQNAIINWQQFNIGSQAGVRFNQPNSTSATLNRVLSSNPSQIFGSLSANGHLFLINPSGIVFGEGSRVDAGGFVASTLNMNDDDFMAARYRFLRNGSTGSILNRGTLTAADGGYIALLAPEVRNEGVIAARLGTVALAAGERVTLNFSGEGLVNVAVEPAAIDTLIENRHLVQADGGRVIMSASAADKLYSSVINTGGEVRARGIENREGRIFLDSGAGGQTTVSGILDVSSADGKGGSIVATGERVLVKSGAHLTASGASGGGEVLVGGSWQGRESAIRQAIETTVENGALLEANATVNGDGGTVVAWSDVNNPLSVTRVYGTFEANGGPAGGNGGRIETSGHSEDYAGVSVSAAAPAGRSGYWLIDPGDENIDQTRANTIATTLNTGTNVRIETYGGRVTLNSNVSIVKTAGGDATLTLWSEGDVILLDGSSIRSTSNRLNLVLWADSDNFVGGYINLLGTAASPVTINTNGGGLWMGGGSGTASWTPYSGGAALTVGDGYATGATTQSIGVLMRSATINTGGGNIAIYGDSGPLAATGGDYGQEADGIRFGCYPLGSQTGVTINSGAGTVLLNGRSRGTGGNYAMGVEFDAAGGITHSVTSAATSGDAITIIGDASGATASGITGGVYFLNGATNLSATGGGISITGTAGNPSPSNEAILAHNLTTLNSAGTMTLNTGSGSGTIDGVISGAGGLTTTGSGTLTLSGANTYTGATTVSAGTLRSGAAGVIADGSAVSVASGATWDLNNYSETVGSIAGAGSFSLGSAALTAGGDNSSTSVSGVISGTGGLIKAGSGTLTLSGANTYTGATNINAGKLVAANATALGDVAGGVTVAGGATLDINNVAIGAKAVTLNGTGMSNAGALTGTGTASLAGAVTLNSDSSVGGTGSLTLSGAIGGGHALTKVGNGTVTLSNLGNSFSGGTAVNAGTLSVSNVSHLGTGNLTLAGGTLQTTGSLNLGSRTVAVNVDSTLSAAAGLTVSGGVFSASGRTLTLTGGGSFSLTNTGNDFGTIAIPSAAGVDIFDSDTLTLGAISATGIIDIATAIGNLTVTENIATGNSSAGAIRLNAGRNAAAGTSTGGNIIVSGGSISVGGGGYATLYSGSVTGSTGLTALIGSGSGRFRYYSDETEMNYTRALTPGVNAVYRELPIVYVIANNETRTYSGVAYSGGAGVTYSGFLNGDTSAGLGGALAYGGSSQGAVSVGSYAITPSGLSSDLGYGLVHTSGNLSIVPPSLSACIANPAAPGCSAVLPSLAACTANPTLAGCSVVLPSLSACIANPAVAGCSAVLPSLSACIANPMLAGCSVVLPGMGTCIANPAAPGCTVVLPSLSTCIANPATAGCSAILPSLSACIANPTAPGCSVVLPTLAACTANPSIAGCSVVLPSLSACAANPTIPGCAAVLPNPTTIASQTSFLNALIGAGGILPPALPPVINPPPELLIEIVSEPVVPEIASAPALPPPETALSDIPATKPGEEGAATAAAPPVAPEPVAGTPPEPGPPVGAPPSAMASAGPAAPPATSGAPAGEGTTSEPAPAEAADATGTTTEPGGTAPTASETSPAPSATTGTPAVEPAPASSPAATVAENFSPSALASGSLDTAALSGMSPAFQSVLSSALARGVSPAEAVQRASNAAAASAAAAQADNSPAASLASGSFATSSPVADSPDYQTALSSLLARGVSPAEAMQRAESATAESAAAARADSSPAASLASGSFALSSPAAASPAYQAALSSLLARGLSPAEAMQRAESAAAESAAAARADNSPAALLASGSFATSPSAASPAYQAALSSMLARGLSPAEAMQRAESAAAESAAAALADARNPLAALASGNNAVLERYQPSGDFSKALAAAMAQGIPMDIAMNRAMQADAMEQQAIRADAASPLAGLSSGRSQLPAGNSDFDQAFAGAIGRGASPAEAVAAAKRTLAGIQADSQTPSIALATGRNVDDILGAVGTSPTFEKALGNALARGMTIDAAVVYAKKVETATALRLPLPPDLAKQVPSAVGSVTVTTVSGKPLPGWIRYDTASRSFIVYDAPSGALPMEVAITVKGKRTVLRISENMSAR